MRVGFGIDRHQFLEGAHSKKLILGGVMVEPSLGMDADSDGDVVLHALCHAITTITHVPILGDIAPKLCREHGITDSRVYLDEGLKSLQGFAIEHIAFVIEGAKPRMQKHVNAIRESVAKLCDLNVDKVGLHITSGNNLNDVGRGKGLSCYCQLTVS